MAANDTLLEFSPRLAEIPLGGTFGASPYLRNDHPILVYDGTSAEYAYFTGVMPQHYAGGDVNVYLHIAYTDAVSGTGIFGASFQRIGDGIKSLDSTTDGGYVYAYIGANATSGYISIKPVSLLSFEIDDVAVGELFRLKVYRYADSGDDTAAGDAELNYIEMREV